MYLSISTSIIVFEKPDKKTFATGASHGGRAERKRRWWMKTALWFHPSGFTAVIVLAFMYLTWAIAAVDNILIHTVFSWHLLSFLLFIKLLYVMYFLQQKKQSVISSMRILSLTCIFWLLKCFRALSFCVGRSKKNAIYGLFCSHYIFWNLSSLFPPPALEVSKL